jgi:hypothetical protein
MKYIFVAGAPGSKWSSVVKNIYYSADIDRTDYSEARTYHHDASGVMELMHLGAYFDPGMEFGEGFCRLSEWDPGDCEREFDRPFSGQGIRIVKSHVFCHHLDYLRKHWPDCPIILVHRPNDACLGWWVKCGHFDITYPLYQEYYQDLRRMAQHIEAQNHDLLTWRGHNHTLPVNNNRELCRALSIAEPPLGYEQYYRLSDVTVEVAR